MVEHKVLIHAMSGHLHSLDGKFVEDSIDINTALILNQHRTRELMPRIVDGIRTF